MKGAYMLTKITRKRISDIVDETSERAREAIGIMYALQLTYNDLTNKGMKPEIVNSMSVIIDHLECAIKQVDDNLSVII